MVSRNAKRIASRSQIRIPARVEKGWEQRVATRIEQGSATGADSDVCKRETHRSYTGVQELEDVRTMPRLCMAVEMRMAIRIGHGIVMPQTMCVRMGSEVRASSGIAIRDATADDRRNEKALAMHCGMAIGKRVGKRFRK